MPTSAQNPFQVTESSPSPPLPEPPEQVVFGIANHKGGVFKTGFALVFSQAISWMQNRMEDILPPRFRDAKILLVDSDPQGNLTEAVGFDPVEIAKSIKDFLEFPNAKSVRDLADNFGILDTPTDNVYLIPSSLQAESYIYELHSALDGITRLRQVLKHLEDRFKIVILDTPPNLQYFTKTAIVASNYIFMPVTPTRHAALGITPMRELVSQAMAIRGDEFPVLLGCVYNGLDRRVRDHYRMYAYLRQSLGKSLFDVVFPTNSRLAENINRHRNVFYQLTNDQRDVLLALTQELFYRAGIIGHDEFMANLDKLGYSIEEITQPKDRETGTETETETEV